MVKAKITLINAGKAFRVEMNGMADLAEIDHEKFVVAVSDIRRVYYNIDSVDPSQRFLTITYTDGTKFDTHIGVVDTGNNGILDTPFNTNEEFYNWLESKIGT